MSESDEHDERPPEELGDEHQLRERVRRLERDNDRLNEQVKMLVQIEQRLYRSQNEMDQQVDRLRILNQFALDVQRETEPDAVIGLALDILEQAYNLDQSIGLLESRDGPRVAATLGIDGDDVDRDRWTDLLGNLGEGRSPLLFSDDDADSHLAKELARAVFGEADGSPVCLVFPLHRGGDVPAGAIVARRDRTDKLPYHVHLPSKDDVPVLNLFQNHVEAAIENILLHAEVRDLADNLEEKVEERTAELQERTASVLLQEATLDATVEGVLVVDRDGDVVSYNHRFQEM